MRRRLALVFILALLVAPAAVPAAHRVQNARPAARPAAPAFTLSRIPDGRTVSLSDLRGKVVLLFFFFPT